ncbi:MAG: hypothetical protein ACREDL_08390 [Bradyrhizobium sp.]
MRRDDLVADVIDVRRRQDRIAAGLAIRPTPDLTRLRACADVRASFADIFADLHLSPPEARTDGNFIAEKLDHLRALQAFAPRELRAVELGRVAATDAGVFTSPRTRS